MTHAIIGWSGLLGQELVSQISENVSLYNSFNIQDISGKSFDTVYFCGLPAEKWRINQNPESDFQNLMNILSILPSMKCDRFILISTIDVLDTSLGGDEECQSYATHPYGKHRRIMEEWVQKTQKAWNIFRLPGLFGKGLKKNIIYDLLFQNNIQNICLDSSFQWYNISNLLRDIHEAISNNIPIIHLFSEPVQVRTIVETYFPIFLESCTGKHAVHYDLHTKYGENGYYISKEEILKDMGEYIAYEQQLQQILPRLAISNISWNHGNIYQIQKILQRYRIQNLEVALTKFRNWEDFHGGVIKELKELPFRFISCQSILFQTCISQIFETPDEFINHYKYVADLCERLSITRIVFGSPKQRHPGNQDPNSMISYFQKIGDISKEHNIKFCIEPNSKLYGCTWLTNLQETYEYVLKVNHPNICINFDLGNYMMECDTTSISDEIISKIGHIQVSNSFLQPFHTIHSSTFIEYFILLAKILRSNLYHGYISLEMKESNYEEIIKSIDMFLKIFDLMDI